MCFCCSCKCLLNCEEETANVDSIECRCKSESSLVSEEKCSNTRFGDEGVNSLRIETISLCLAWVVCKFNSVVNYTTLLNSHTIQARRKEIVSILRESTPSSPNLVLEHFSSEIKPPLRMHPRLIESTFAVSSLQLSRHLQEQQKHNSLNSMMS